MSAIHSIDDAASVGLPLHSGIFERGAQQPVGWGLVVLDVELERDRRVVPLADGAVVGSETTADARLEGCDVAGRHARVEVRADGVVVEDLGSAGGIWVQGVRVQRAELEHGDLVRLGGCLTMFVEHGLAAHRGPPVRLGQLALGPALRVWFEDLVTRVGQGKSVCIEGPPGTGKRSIAQRAAEVRPGEVVVVQPGAAAVHGDAPRTWVVLDADRLDRAHAAQLTAAIRAQRGAVVIATINQPLAQAVAQGGVMHGFRALFADNVLRLPPWNKRLHDLPIVLAAKAEAANIDRARLTAAFVERIALAGWAGGAERLDTLLADAGQEGPLEAAVVAAQTPRLQAGARLPLTALDPDLARSRLADALARGHGSIAAAARILGVTRQCVYREALRLGLELSRASHN